MQIFKRLFGKRLHGNRHVLNAFRTSLRGHDHFVERVAVRGHGLSGGEAPEYGGNRE